MFLRLLFIRNYRLSVLFPTQMWSVLKMQTSLNAADKLIEEKEALICVRRAKSLSLQEGRSPNPSEMKSAASCNCIWGQLILVAWARQADMGGWCEAIGKWWVGIKIWQGDRLKEAGRVLIQTDTPWLHADTEKESPPFFPAEVEIFGTTKKARGRQINKVEGQVAKSFAYLAANELILLVEDCGRGKNDTLPGFRPGIRACLQGWDGFTGELLFPRFFGAGKSRVKNAKAPRAIFESARKYRMRHT